MIDSFSPTFKWIVPSISGLNGGLQCSCEIEASYMGKKPTHMGKGGRKTIISFQILMPN